jgi:hypothetical protein
MSIQQAKNHPVHRQAHFISIKHKNYYLTTGYEGRLPKVMD